MLRTMRLSLLVISLLAAASPGRVFADDMPSKENQDSKDFISLFDGKTLEGWEGNLDWFRVEDGAIVAGTMNKDIPRNEFLCTTKKYSNFELRLKVKLVGGEKANAGVQFRTARIPDDHEVIGYQADMGEGWWGALYDESRRRKVLAGPNPKEAEKLVKKNEWNDYVIRCEGAHIQLWLNGVQTVDYLEQDDQVDRSGVLAVQIHAGPPTEAWYKDIKIKELTP